MSTSTTRNLAVHGWRGSRQYTVVLQEAEAVSDGCWQGWYRGHLWTASLRGGLYRINSGRQVTLMALVEDAFFVGEGAKPE